MTKRATIELEILEPEHFPDLAAVRAFVHGHGRVALEAAVRSVLTPSGPLAGALAPQLLERARVAASCVVGDLSQLVSAAVDGTELRRVEGIEAFEPFGAIHARRDLLVAALSSVRLTEALEAELIRYLAGEPAREAA